MDLKIKVCGMRQPFNIRELVKLNPDYIGFIFYPKSKRFIGEVIPEEIHSLIPGSIQKVGVFVNEPFESLVEKWVESNLDIIQLHGGELPDYCKRLKVLNIPVIKAFSITSDFDFNSVYPFEKVCDYFLFDSATELRGGSGLKFNWDILNQYKGTRPFFLSGGIQCTDIDAIKSIMHNKLYAVDVNSGFEIEAGLKDLLNLAPFIYDFKNFKV